MVFIILLALFVGIPALELATFIKVGAQVGVFNTIAFTFLTAIIGVGLVRHQGFQALTELRQAADEGRPPVLEIVSGALLLLAGVLLFIPGFITDAIGFVLLIPPLRKALAAWIVARLASQVQAQAHVCTDPSGATIIEAEVVEIEDEPERIGHEDSPWRKK